MMYTDLIDALSPSGFAMPSSMVNPQALTTQAAMLPAAGASMPAWGGPAVAGAGQLAQSLVSGDLWEKPLTSLRKVGGAVGGSAAGAALGSAVAPGPGTMIGGALGSMFGGK
jgi:hypothetical protein